MTLTIPILRVWVNPEIEGLRELYKQHILDHNNRILSDPHPNSGFDLFVPDIETFINETNKARLVNHQIKAAMYDRTWGQTHLNETSKSCAYYLYPRSSIYKTPLMLANSAGIIDSGYRGWICSAFRFLPSEAERVDDSVLYSIEKNTRLTQICHPNLVPFLVELVDDEAILESTTRGEGGFGSTGV